MVKTELRLVFDVKKERKQVMNKVLKQNTSVGSAGMAYNEVTTRNGTMLRRTFPVGKWQQLL